VPLAVLEALEGEEESTPLRLPLSCGVPREVADAEAPEAPAARVVDVVFAASVAAAARADERLRALLAQTALAHLAAKLGWRLESCYKLPRRRCFDAPPRTQRVRLPERAPLIAELPASATAAPPSARPPPSTAAPAAAPSLSFEGAPCCAMRARFPSAPAAARLRLRQGELALLDGSGAEVGRLPLPFEADAEAATAWEEGGALLARIPVLPYADAVQRARAGREPPLDLEGSEGEFLDLLSNDA